MANWITNFPLWKWNFIILKSIGSVEPLKICDLICSLQKFNINRLTLNWVRGICVREAMFACRELKFDWWWFLAVLTHLENNTNGRMFMDHVRWTKIGCMVIEMWMKNDVHEDFGAVDDKFWGKMLACFERKLRLIVNHIFIIKKLFGWCQTYNHPQNYTAP